MCHILSNNKIKQNIYRNITHGIQKSRTVPNIKNLAQKSNLIVQLSRELLCGIWNYEQNGFLVYFICLRSLLPPLLLLHALYSCFCVACFFLFPFFFYPAARVHGNASRTIPVTLGQERLQYREAESVRNICRMRKLMDDGTTDQGRHLRRSLSRMSTIRKQNRPTQELITTVSSKFEFHKKKKRKERKLWWFSLSFPVLFLELGSRFGDTAVFEKAFPSKYHGFFSMQRDQLTNQRDRQSIDSVGL